MAQVSWSVMVIGAPVKPMSVAYSRSVDDRTMSRRCNLSHRLRDKLKRQTEERKYCRMANRLVWEKPFFRGR